MTIYYPYHKDDFLRSIPHLGAIICLDVGTKRIGVASSDVTRLVATPVEVIFRETFAKVVQRLTTLLHQHTPVGIVLGYPLEMSGIEGVSCQRVRHFAHNLNKALEAYGQSMPILLWDERLSTRGAEAAMLEADLSRKNRAKRRDKIAASLILQGFLEYSTFVGPSPLDVPSPQEALQELPQESGDSEA